MPEDLTPVEQPPLTQDELADQVVEFVRTHDWVTFVELGKRFGHLIETTGHMVIELRDYPNVIMWMGLSQAWAALLMRLIDEQRLFYHPTSPFVYLYDGGLPQLPIVKRPRAYKQPHWAPACFRTVPMSTTTKKGRT